MEQLVQDIIFEYYWLMLMGRYGAISTRDYI